MKLERESAGGFSEAEERAAWVVGVASADLSAWREFGRGAAGFAGGWVGGGGDWAGFGDWAARRDLSANAEARKIASPSPSTLLARQLTKSTVLSAQISTLDTSADLPSAYFPRRST